jgi:glycine cleavage system aminomethyltransferase T
MIIRVMSQNTGYIRLVLCCSQGPEALQLLQTLCCSDIGKADIGDVVSTLMLNENGGCEVQCDVIRLDHDRWVYLEYQ